MQRPEQPDNINVISCDNLRGHLQSESYREALQQTFATRARINQLLGRFLLDHPWGQFLVKSHLFNDPVLEEEQNHEQRVRTLSEQIAETLPQARPEDIELLTRLEPDFQPRIPEQIILETCIDKLVRFQRLAREDFNPNRDLGFSYKISFTKVVNILPAMPDGQRDSMEELLSQTLIGCKSAEMRDRFYLLLSNRDWPGFLEFLEHHQNDMDYGSQLNSLVFQHRHYIFPNEHFRAAIFKHMMTVLITQGEAQFERFDAFWQNAGLDMADPQELRRLSERNFPQEQWNNLMNENTPRYFALLELLHSFGIRP